MTDLGMLTLAGQSFGFAVTSVILALIAAAVILAVEELGFRSVFQRRIVRRWLERRIFDAKHRYRNNAAKLSFLLEPAEIEYRLSSLTGRPYSLPYRQLCGQIAAALQADWQGKKPGPLIEVFALDSEPSTPPLNVPESEYAARKQFTAERGLDDLQAELARRWAQLHYVEALLIPALLLWTFVWAATSITGPVSSVALRILYVALLVVAALYVPLGLSLLERLGRSRI